MSTLQVQSPTQLHHLCIDSPNPERLARFYAEYLGLEETLSGDLHVMRGGARSVVIGQGVQAALRYAAYAFENDEALEVFRERLIRHDVRFETVTVPLFHPCAIHFLDPQGRGFVFGTALESRTQDREPARLQHAVFQSTELERVVTFFTEKIGFTVSDEVVTDEGEAAVVFMRSDDEHHSLAFFRGSKNEWDHHCYETDEWNDIRGWGDKFARGRIPIFFGPGRHGPGNNLFFMVTDTDGNRLEFSAELQRVEAAAAPGVWPNGEYTLNSWGRAWMRS
jgi:catechol 2,3-dioxygenase